MEVTDCEQLMRATLRAYSILKHLRGMHHVGIEGVDIDLDAWLARADSIEMLDEFAHRDVARAFFTDMLSHATKAAIFGPTDARHQIGATDAKAQRQAARAANSHVESRQGIVIEGKVELLDHLMRSYSNFILRMHPLVFIAPEGAERPHARLDYRLAMLVHCGTRMASIKQTILASLDALRKLRAARAPLLGGVDCPARLFLVVWRDDYHPCHGKQRTKLRTTIDEVARKVAPENISIEYHTSIELQYDATRNERVPRHIAVERTTVPGIATISDAEFPALLLDDVQAKLHDFRVGQIIQIQRRDIENGLDEVDYRIVKAN